MKLNKLKPILISILLGLLLSSNLYSQSPLVVNGSEVSYYYHKTGTTYDYMVNGAYSIGMLTNIGGHDWEKYRSTYEFNISSLPSNATITAVKLSYSVSSEGNAYDDFSVTDYQVTGSSSYSERWNAIDDATVIFNNLSGSSGSNKTSSTLTNRVNNSRTLNWFTLGTFSNDEATDNSNAITSITVTIEYTVTPTTINLTAQNDMDGYNGGNIGVGVNTSATSKSSPYSINDANVGDDIYLTAYENQTYGGYNYIWNAPDETESPDNKSKWEREIGNSSSPIPNGSNNQSASYEVLSTDNGADLVGYLRKICNLTFTNSFNGISSTGSIKVDGSIVTAPTAQYPVVEGNTIEVEAIEYTDTANDVTYEFSHWSDDNSTTNPRTITADSHENITAVFIGRAIFLDSGINNRDMQFNIGSKDKYITLYWNEHISPNVTQYKVYRRDNGTSSQLIATINRGTTRYVDYDYKLSTNPSDVTLGYNVRAYYSPDQTESYSPCPLVYGIQVINKMNGSDSLFVDLQPVQEFALNSNYPNPFNPTTQISYQIPENSFVNLVVYNSLGQEVTTLVNQNQSMGKYTVQFNASNLPSGVYIYKLQAGEFSSTKKMLLMK